jgi:hypothetical protein
MADAAPRGRGGFGRGRGGDRGGDRGRGGRRGPRRGGRKDDEKEWCVHLIPPLHRYILPGKENHYSNMRILYFTGSPSPNSAVS